MVRDLRGKAGLIGRSTVAVAAAVLTVSCAGGAWKGFGPGAEQDYVWPRPPLPPRIEYVTSIHSHEDLFQTGGLWGAVARLFAGGPDSSLSRPYAIAVHPEGGLLVSDAGRQVVHFFDWSHRKYISIGGQSEGGLASPVGVGVMTDGSILVCDSRLGRVLKYAPDGRYLGVFADAEEFGRPAGLSVSQRSGEVFVADVTNHVIAVFSPEGRRIRTLGGRGSEPGQFNFPTHLAIDPKNRLLVTDSMNFRVQMIEPDGRPLRSYGSLGAAEGQFSKPKGVAADRTGRVIVVEGLYDALQIFGQESELLISLGEPGSDAGQFWLPAGLTVDLDEGLLFVADSYNSRVQVFRFLDGPEHNGTGPGLRTESETVK